MIPFLQPIDTTGLTARDFSQSLTQAQPTAQIVNFDAIPAVPTDPVTLKVLGRRDDNDKSAAWIAHSGNPQAQPSEAWLAHSGDPQAQPSEAWLAHSGDPQSQPSEAWLAHSGDPQSQPSEAWLAHSGDPQSQPSEAWLAHSGDPDVRGISASAKRSDIPSSLEEYLRRIRIQQLGEGGIAKVKRSQPNDDFLTIRAPQNLSPEENSADGENENEPFHKWFRNRLFLGWQDEPEPLDEPKLTRRAAREQKARRRRAIGKPDQTSGSLAGWTILGPPGSYISMDDSEDRS